MIFKIAGGINKDIQVGNLVRIKSGYIPTAFEGKQLEVTKIQEGYPFLRFYQEEKFYDAEGVEQTKVVFDEESAISPEIIVEVL